MLYTRCTRVFQRAIIPGYVQTKIKHKFVDKNENGRKYHIENIQNDLFFKLMKQWRTVGFSADQ